MITIVITVLVCLTVLCVAAFGFTRWYMLTYLPPGEDPPTSPTRSPELGENAEEIQHLERMLRAHEKSYERYIREGLTLLMDSERASIREVRRKLKRLRQ